MLVLHMQLKTIDTSEARQHILCVHLNLRIGNVGRPAVYLLHNALIIIALASTLVPFLQFQREVTIRRGLLKAVRVARNERVDAQLRQVLDTCLHLLEDAVGLLQTATWRRLHINKHSTHILVGHQSCTSGFHHPTQGHKGENHK